MRVLTRTRSRTRRLGALDLAIAFALAGSLLAVAVPTFVRQVHASRFVEPMDGVEHIAASAVEYARAHPSVRSFPQSAPMTPSSPPRGKCEADPPELWERPAWRALDFRPVPPGQPHCFAFAFDSAQTQARATFRAHAHGDLDGDGITSTFEVTGQIADDLRGPVVDPGIFVDAEVE